MKIRAMRVRGATHFNQRDIAGIRVPKNLNKKHLSKNKSGQALMEYALLIAVAAAVSLGFMSSFNSLMQRGITTFNAILEQELRTGGYAESVRIWDN